MNLVQERWNRAGLDTVVPIPEAAGAGVFGKLHQGRWDCEKGANHYVWRHIQGHPRPSRQCGAFSPLGVGIVMGKSGLAGGKEQRTNLEWSEVIQKNCLLCSEPLGSELWQANP